MASMQTRNWRLFSSLLAGTALLVSGQAVAQETSTPQDAAAADARAADSSEIVVTAQRVEERALDVPLSVQAVTGAEIERRGVESLVDMQYAIPGLTFTGVFGEADRVQIRGVSQFLGTPTVGTYLDELSVNPPFAGGGIDIRLIDIDRVEILRGPQPTLYGESSMGGTIRYIAASPDLNAAFGRAEGEVGDIKDGGILYRVEGMVNMPLVADKLAIRLAGAYESIGGWIDTNRGKDSNDRRIMTLRGKLLFEPTDQLSISLLGLHQESERDDALKELENRTSQEALRGDSRTRNTAANLVATYDLGPVTLLSSTGFLDNSGNVNVNLSAGFTGFIDFAASLPPFSLPLGSITRAGVRAPNDFRRWSQEARLFSNGEGPLTYLVGAVYTDDKSDSVNVIFTEPIEAPFVVQDSQITNTSESWSVYGEIGYEFFDRLEMRLGGRYFEDKRGTDDFLASFVGTPFGGPPVRNIDENTFNSFNPRVNVSYKTSEDGLIYFNVAKGFRSGGFNNAAAAPPGEDIPLTFGPEKLWTYEVGLKQQLLDRRLTIEAAIYYNDWTDIQTATATETGIPIIDNSGKASGLGADVALTARASDYLTATMTMAYNGAEYKEASTTHAPGDPLDNVPKYTASASLDYRRPIGVDTDLIAHADIGFNGGAQVTVRVFGPIAVSPIPSREIVNARIGADFGRFQAFVFGENLTDNNEVTFPVIGSLGEPIRSRPRTIGVTVAAKF